MFDTAGKAYEDFHGVQSLGHRNPAVATALKSYLDGDAPSWYPSRVNPFSGRFARELCGRSGYERVYFGCTGADAVDAAMKLARAATRRPRILGMEQAYHGCTLGSTALMSPGSLRDPFGPHLPGVSSLPFGDSDALQKALATDDVAAVVVEPIQGEGGVRPLPTEFIESLGTMCAEHGTLLVADEVQTGLGRSGAFLLSSRWPRRPDVVCMGKALGGGLMPVSAMLTDAKTFERAYGQHFEAGESHNATFGQNALSSVAGLATLDLLTDELIDGVREKGKGFRRVLRESLAGSPLFAEVRGDGLMIGIEFKDVKNPWLSFKNFGLEEFSDRPSIGPLMCMRLYRRGYLCYLCAHNWRILRLQPRLDIGEEKLRDFARCCREEMDFLEGLE